MWKKILDSEGVCEDKLFGLSSYNPWSYYHTLQSLSCQHFWLGDTLLGDQIRFTRLTNQGTDSGTPCMGMAEKAGPMCNLGTGSADWSTVSALKKIWNELKTTYQDTVDQNRYWWRSTVGGRFRYPERENRNLETSRNILILSDTVVLEIASLECVESLHKPLLFV